MEELAQPSALRLEVQQGRQQHLQQLVSLVQQQEPPTAPLLSLPALTSTSTSPAPRTAPSPHQLRTSSSNLLMVTHPGARAADSTPNLPTQAAQAAASRPSTALGACHSPEPDLSQHSSRTNQTGSFPPLSPVATPPGTASKEDGRPSAGTAVSGGAAGGSSAARTSAHQLLQGVTAIAMDKGKWGGVRISYSQFVEVVGTCLVVHSLSLHKQDGGSQPQSLKISDPVLEHFGVRATVPLAQASATGLRRGHIMPGPRTVLVHSALTAVATSWCTSALTAVATSWCTSALTAVATSWCTSALTAVATSCRAR